MLDLIGKGKSKGGAPSTASAAAATKDATDASFMTDVVEASRAGPVIVDFWAPWCGPCRQLTPALERVVAATKGAVRLVKVNVDDNPRIAAQLRVQSIPTVYAFIDGQPVDGFQGALPESQLKAFIDRLIPEEGPSDLAGLLEAGAAAAAAGDLAGAAGAFGQALQLEPGHPKAVAGLARCYLAGGDVARAAEVAALAPADLADPDLQAVRSAIALALAGGAETAGLERRLAADPSDHDARFQLAGAFAAKGRFAEAADHLLTIIAADRNWREGEARQKLLTVLDAAGPGSEVARAGRRRLSSLLFS
jgi:putative thioredoxin